MEAGLTLEANGKSEKLVFPLGKEHKQPAPKREYYTIAVIRQKQGFECFVIPMKLYL